MRDATHLAISNIAWQPDEDEVVADLLHREGITGVELAPTKWRERPLDASADDIVAYRRTWEDRGLRVVSLQSLLFGRPDLQLFGGDAARVALADYLRRVIDFGALLGARALVFGSPKNRLRGSITFKDATDIAAPFFHTLGAHASARGISFCIEANPPEYGCDFVTTTAEAAELCAVVDHPGIRINADLGGMTLAGEDPLAAIQSAKAFIAHVHASEPHLAELGAAANHGLAASALDAIEYDGWVSIEMRAGTTGDNVDAIERAVRRAKQEYVLPNAVS
jgi:D-psicose/D-tagatose/L-ribulose 3-epimerase